MTRQRRNENAASRRRAQQPAPKAETRAAAEATRNTAPTDFPFARTQEDDDLRDLSGYGWGV